jgi:hypothetical protein
MTTALLPHDWQHRSHHLQCTKNIGVKLAANGFITHFFDHTDCTVTRVVDQHINATKGINRSINRIVNFLGIGDIQTNGFGGAWVLRYQIIYSGSQLCAVQF